MVIWDINIVHNFEVNQFNKLKIYVKIITACFQIVFLFYVYWTVHHLDS
jgi:hypothetical protein